jgi:hypothetical protein
MTAKPEIMRERQSEKLTDILNDMIGAGVCFDVSENEFQILNAERLNQAAIDFLTVNRREVLCTLQQSLLVKHLFSHAEHSFEDFSDEAYEREGILTDGGKVSIEAHFEAVRDVTKKWFAGLLNGVQPNEI